MNKYNFLSGLPRSGSTLLASLLNQHPHIHATATSSLLELLVTLASSVQQNRTFYEITDSQEINLYNGIMESYYKHINKNGIANNDLIFIDKHRNWPSLIPALRKLGIEAKIICTNRNIADIIASYINLINKNPDYPNFIDELIVKRGLEVNTLNRVTTIWNDYVNIPYNVLKNAIKENPNNLLFINYDDLVYTPNTVLDRVCNFIGIECYNGYDFSNIINNQPEKDETGWKLKGLHDIRKNLEKTSKSAEETIGKELTDHYNQYNIIM